MDNTLPMVSSNLPTIHTSTQSLSIHTLISQALDKNIPVETMERLLAMAKEMRADEAKEQFDRDMAKFQYECPVIAKTKAAKDKNGIVMYWYAPIEVIITQVKGLMFECNFSYQMETCSLEGRAKATCRVKHILGHKDEVSVELPFITKTNLMSDAHVVEGTLTIAKRLAFCNAFGILTANEDTNARLERSNITQEQIQVIEELVKKLNAPIESVLSHCKVSTITEVTEAQALSVIRTLRKKLETNHL